MNQSCATTRQLTVAFEQCNQIVGDITANVEAMLSAARQAVDARADIVVFAELSLVGYPPEDLLFRADLRQGVERALVRLCDARLPIDIVLGYPEVSSAGIYNAACVIRHGERVANYRTRARPRGLSGRDGNRWRTTKATNTPTYLALPASEARSS